ncbi:hypothetical protein [Flavisolibacter ginsenosidimutans]|uniref:Tetratricopeptide repeat protein n=1 Tax=Flavisolibacter ginsenosidimutans TaxID=661481 RepID=A0A5B8UPP8_9BACT|nr:hypothetical protein [Flavisolibacter ginsenosidimutans]QEC58342.1 hypothetical protein FSB75_21355 [Flavisolibacter ginsenosidimutans]
MKARSHIYTLLVILLVSLSYFSQAQPGFHVDIKKDKPFTERKLKSEKTSDGQLKTPKRIFQNLTTRFNYYFNANNKFNEIIERAKMQQKDDYSQLLSFYPYTLEATAADSTQLDSVIYKCRTGIVNHDLRSEWGDDLYLLWASSWHLQKKFDSASMMLQFINYAYAPQDEYGYYSYIGTHKDGAQELSIATKEDKKFLHSNTFSRNNAFIWQIRTRIEMGDMVSSGSLITTLKRDPAFPKRLHNALDEVEAYWYYKQGLWDSAAVHLTAALEGAETKREKARQEYLIAQLFERSGKTGEATKHFAKAVDLTPDPVLDVYARLNLVRLNKEGGDNAIDKNIAELLKMAKRDKYEDYRDIIYYTAAQMEMERANIPAALELLMKGAKYNNGNLASRSKAFLQLADVSYDQKKYIQAAAFYDSLQVADLLPKDAERVNGRKPGLKIVADNSAVVTRQDSLQRIAALPKEQRDELVKKMVKQLRKQQGLKEDAAPTAGSQQLSASPSTDLFSSAAKGDWYFYNTTSRTQGAAEFKQVWGNRPNVDNWRRFAVINQQLQNRTATNGRDARNLQVAAAEETDLTVESLSAKLPTTPESLKASNDSIKTALLNLGAAFLNALEDYPSAINTFEEYRKRFPDGERMDEVLFNLYYAYTKAGNTSQAAAVKKLLLEKYASSRYANILATGKDPQAKAEVSPEATKAYEGVYNLFIEGKFDEAVAAKREADSVYKTTFWQPQLLYIESVYYIRQRQDSVAKAELQTIIRQNTHAALTEKARTLLSVLNRRKQIEDELNRYQIQPQAEDSVAATDATPELKRPDVAAVTTSPPKKEMPTVKAPGEQKEIVTAKTPEVKKADTVAKKPLIVKADTVSKKPQVKTTDTLAKKTIPKKAAVDTIVKKNVSPPKPASIYTFAPETAHYVLMILDKVDPVFVNEARNAFFRYNREKYYGQPLDAQILSLTADVKLLVVTGFANASAATDYVQRARAVASTEIIPWLTGNKYTFTIISAPNLEILKGTTNLAEYKKFLEQYLPGKF